MINIKTCQNQYLGELGNECNKVKTKFSGKLQAISI